ncbi:MAG: hypothetical protein R3C56_32820 [Pirellulaceae bacterium]
MFQHVLQRSPSESAELTDAALVQATEETRSTPPGQPSPIGSTVMAGSEVASSPMVDFTHFPFQRFGSLRLSYRSSLGWVQLSAEGGHPGNDTDHAVRRWTAPRDESFASAVN